MIRPRPIGPGDTLRMIGLSGCIHENDVPAAVEQCKSRFEAMGFHVQVDRTCYAQYGYLAGTDQERAEALMQAFEDPQVDGIVSLKGGWGVNRMLPLIDFGRIRAHPKAFIGFSDITSLHLALHRHADLCTFHGPMGTTSASADADVRDALLHALAGHPDTPFQPMPFEILRPGACVGEIVGGNLSLLCAALGTPWDLDFRDRILMIEEIHEPVYCIDRYLCHLRNAGKLEGLAGLAFGAFTNCESEYPDSGFELGEILSQYSESLDFPVISSLSFGHIPGNRTLPLGVRYRLDTEEGFFGPA